MLIRSIRKKIFSEIYYKYLSRLSSWYIIAESKLADRIKGLTVLISRAKDAEQQESQEITTTRLDTNRQWLSLEETFKSNIYLHKSYNEANLMQTYAWMGVTFEIQK